MYLAKSKGTVRLLAKRSTVFLLLLFSTLGLAQVIPQISAAPQTVLAVSPTNSAAPAGTVFRVALTVSNITKLYAYNITLGYNGSLLKVSNATLQGTWFNITNTPYQVRHLQWNDTLGSVHAEVWTSGAFPGLTGNGTLLFINFLAPTTGATSTLTIDTTTSSLINPALNSIAFTTRNGSFTERQVSSNIIKNPSFEQGLDMSGKPVGWSLATFEGVANATVALDPSLKVDGNYSAKISVGPILCSPSCPTRPVGFAQFSQTLPVSGGTTFANLTDSPAGLGFSFYLKPYPSYPPSLGTSLKSDANVKFVDANGNGVWDPGETVVYDTDSNGLYDTGEPVIAGTAPTNGALLKADPKIRFVDSNGNNVWDGGEAIIYDTNSDNVYDTADSVIPLALKTDPKLKFVDSDNNNVWDPGETVVYDTNNNGVYDTGPLAEPIIAGRAPTNGTLLKTDSKVKFVDANNNNVWDTGETVVYDSDSNGAYDPGEPAIASMGDFRVRIFGAENSAELDYIFDPDPGLYYQNQTGTVHLIFRGFDPGHWFKFTRNLRADWIAAGFPLDTPLRAVQFEGLAIQPPLRSETFWIDNTTLLAGPVLPGYEPPKVSFNFQPSAPLVASAVTFNASASYEPDSGGFIASYRWDFGDGSPLARTTGPVIQHIFNQPGAFRATLTVTDDLGMSNAMSLGVTVKIPPPCPGCPAVRLSIAPDPENVLVGTTVTFNGTSSSDPGGLPLQYSWNLGDGSTVTGSIVTHAYSSPGTFFVRLDVKNSLGLGNFTITTVTVSLVDIRVTKSSVFVPYMMRGAQTQTISASTINIGNVPVYVYATFTVLYDRKSLTSQYSSNVQRLDVRGTYDISVSYSQSQDEGRYLVVLTLFTSTIALPAGGPGWTVSSQEYLVYRVLV